LQGVLAQAKNGEEVFWEDKFHGATGKAKYKLFFEELP
jgi:hypothetical protein